MAIHGVLLLRRGQTPWKMTWDLRRRMSSFSGSQSYRKEDLSVKLKAQNIKNARSQTKRLEVETKKMEDRLQELKFAMSKEKEERESQGGVFWSRGQSGSLLTYAGEVLSKSSAKRNKENKQPESPAKSPKSQKRKVKLLKDQPIELPQRSAQPGTMSYIAQRSSEPSSKVKGPKCGQCEDRPAVWTCVQCSEDYCAGCFAAFHCKGALKKHRSVPLKNAGPRKFMSPRPTPPVSAREISCKIAEGAVASEDLEDAILYQSEDYKRNGPEGASGMFDGALLATGEYNEAESAASFQQALKAWRKGEGAVSGNTPTPRSSQLYSPVMTPVVAVDSCTGTIQKSTPIEIEFKTHSVSYADRLLLKKHRRTDIDGLETPRANSRTPRADDFRPSSRHSYSRNSSRPSSSAKLRSSSKKQQNLSQQSYDREDTESILASRVSFQALYNAVVPDHHEEITPRPISSLSIIELNDHINPSHSIEETSSCVVQEIDSTEVWVDVSQKRNASVKSPESFSKSKPPSSSRKLRNKSAKEKPFEDSNSNNTAKEIENEKPPSKSRPSSSRPKSARPKSSLKSRPSSRAQSRAASRLQGEGILTKAVDHSLKDVAARQRDEYLENTEIGLGDFFMAGVKVLPQEDRIITPRSSRPKSSRPLSSRSTTKQKVKVSNQLYHMAPRSWRPDSSLSEAIPVDQISVDDNKQGSVLAYSYSGQLSGQPTKVQSIQTSMVGSGAMSGRYTPLYDLSTPRSGTPVLKNSQALNRPLSRSNTRPGSVNSTRSQSSMSRIPNSGRISKAIVMEGEDLSKYDEVGFVDTQGSDDNDTLNNLEWELASESGRVTADGKISRLELSDDYNRRSGSASSGNLTQRNLLDQGFDINSRLSENELLDEKFSSPVSQDENDVKALR